MTRLENRTMDVDRTAFDPRDIVEHAVEMCVGDDRSVSLRLNVHPETPQVLVSDPRRVGQVVINLLSNAMKFGKDKPIEVVMSPAQHADMSVRLEVADKGCGIKPAQ